MKPCILAPLVWSFLRRCHSELPPLGAAATRSCRHSELLPRRLPPRRACHHSELPPLGAATRSRHQSEPPPLSDPVAYCRPLVCAASRCPTNIPGPTFNQAISWGFVLRLRPNGATWSSFGRGRSKAWSCRGRHIWSQPRSCLGLAPQSPNGSCLQSW